MDQPDHDATGDDAASVLRPACAGPGPWSGLGTVVLYFLLQIGIAIAVGTVVGFVLALKRGLLTAPHSGRIDLHAIVQATRGNSDILVVITVVSIAAAAVAMALLVRRAWPDCWSRADLPGFGLHAPRRRSDYGVAVLLGLGILLVGNLLTQWLAGGQPINQDVVLMAERVTPAMRILLALLVVAVAPFVEELVFRGVLLSGLARRIPVGWAIVASAVVFGCAHLPDFGFAWYAVPALVLLGVVLGWLRVRSGSLWPAVVLHATNNFIAVLAWFLVSPHV